MLCWEEGQCDGHFIADMTLRNDSQCLDACKGEDACVWFNYKDEDNSCVLLEDCPIIEQDCNDCVTGHRLCTDEGANEPSGEGIFIFLYFKKYCAASSVPRLNSFLYYSHSHFCFFLSKTTQSLS